MKTKRRSFLKMAALGTGGALAASVPAVAGESPSAAPDALGVLMDTTRCIGCRRCEFACQQAHGFDPPPVDQFDDRSVFGRQRRPDPRNLTVVNRYLDDPGTPVHVKLSCMHCVRPACVSACLVGALQKDPRGPVTYDASRCMGCRYCMVACPFELPAYEYDKALTPRVRKCDLCAEEVLKIGGVPACVRICPEEALVFGERAALLELAHETITRSPERYQPTVYGEHEVGGTSLMFLSSVPFEDLGLWPLASEPPSALTERIQHGTFKWFGPPAMLYGLLGAVMWINRRKDAVGAEVSP